MVWPRRRLSCHSVDHRRFLLLRNYLPRVEFITNYFLGFRENILRHSLATWRGAYDALVARGRCSGLGSESDATARNASQDRDRGKDHAGALEHLAHLIWGDAQSTVHHGPKWRSFVGEPPLALASGAPDC